MNEEFNDLFNENFGEDDDSRNEGLNKIIDLMSRLNQGGGLDGFDPDEASLGKPTTIREFERDGVTFEESTWETPHGTIVRITTKDDIEFSPDFFNNNNIPFGKTYEREVELSLEDRLEMVVKSEDYEEAAIIRDLIIERDNKDKPSETLDKKGVSDKDEWNF
jgi:hypothetical protein